MNYYKMFYQENFISIITSNNFYQYNKYTNLFFSSNQSLAQCIIYDNKLYRIAEMQPLPLGFDYKMVKLIPATQAQYEEFKSSIENNQPIDIIFPQQPEEEKIPEQPKPQISEQPEQHKMTIQQMREKIPEQPKPQISEQPEQHKMTIQQMRDKILEQQEQIKALTAYILGLE